MITPEHITGSLQALSSLIVIVAVTKFSKPLTDAILNETFIFVVSTLYFYNTTGSVPRSFVYGFLAVVLLKTATAIENFNLISPTPNSGINCLKVTKKDLVDKFGSEAKLKKAMIESGVPYNMTLDDFNAPEIATYIANNSAYASVGPCKLIV